MASRLLIAAAGTGTGFSYALALAQRHSSVALITSDTNDKELISASVFAEQHVKAAAFDPCGHVERVNDLIRQYDVTHYLPLIDAEIRCAAAEATSIHAVTIAPDAAFCSFAGAKDRYSDVLEPLGIEVPQVVIRESPSFPCFAKPIGGFGGRGTRVLRSEADLADLPEGYALQGLLVGPEFTVDCFPMPGSAPPFCSIRERIEVKAGVCTKARIEPNSELEAIAAKIAARFDLRHPFCFQAIRDHGYRVTDVNPRLGAGTAMSAANGADFFAAHLAAVFGGDLQWHLRRYRDRCTVTRQYVDYLHAVSCA